MFDPLTWFLLTIIGMIALAVWAHGADEKDRHEYFEKHMGSNELLDDSFLDQQEDKS